MSNKTAEPFSLTCKDGTQLGATRYTPSQNHRAEILVAGATAVPQGFYRRFAEFANTQGFAVTTLDYRGIGKSAPPTLRGYRCDYLDWGRQDLAAALENIKSRMGQSNTEASQPDSITNKAKPIGDGKPAKNFDENQSNAKPIYMIGHSYGGHGFGLMPNHGDVKAFYTFASGAGWSGHMPKAEQLKVGFLWHVLGPLIVPALGYMPGQFLGGENLPRDVYRQWKRWCSFPHYFFDDPLMQSGQLDGFKNVRTPIAAVNALDDLWAPPTSRDHFFKGYQNTELTFVTLDPKALQYPIGHMGYFRQGREAIWADAIGK
jgi:predicted alpha/beta hydrolase